MLHLRQKGQFALLAALLVASLAFAACGSDDNGSADGSAGASTAQSEGQSAGSATGGVAAATKAIEPLLKAPSPIPIKTPLKRIPKGETFVYVQCGVPECAFMGKALQDAAKTMGVGVKIINGGNTAQSAEQAFATAAELKPAAVIQAALDPAGYPAQLKRLMQQGTPVVAAGIPQPAGEGADVVINGPRRFANTGRLMADYIVSKSNGKAKAVFFWPPEFSVFGTEAESFEAEMKEKCPGCSVELEQAPASTIGSTLPSRIVSYLQQNPDTNWVAGAFGSMLIGLPQALRAAGLQDQVKLISQAGGQVNFQYLKDGTQAADLSNDLAVEAWMYLDLAARMATGQGAEGIDDSTSPPQKFVEAGAVDFDPAAGFTSFPDYKEQFKKLWGLS